VSEEGNIRTFGRDGETPASAFAVTVLLPPPIR
jgi:hypothetical protein